MLRLDPAHPPVWSSDTRLQFGVDAVLVLDDPLPWQERLVHALQRGVLDPSFPAVAAEAGAPPAAVDDFLAQLRPALLQSGRAVAYPVSLHVADGFSAADAAAFVTAFEASGHCVVTSRWFGTYDELDALEPVVVLLGGHVIEPGRAAALSSRDIVHLPVVFTADRAEIGPLISPGDGPCLSCVEAHRRDDDPAWPRIAAQLIGLRSPEIGAAVIGEAGLIAARLVSDPDRPRAIGRSLLIHDDSLPRRWRSHRPHAECRCRSLARTGTDHAPGSPPLATTTARGSDQHG